MSYLRNDISECLRAIKRQVKLDRLKALIDSETLTVEELKELKNGLNNEKRFNKRLLEKYGSSEGVQRKPKKSPKKVEKQVQISEEPKIESQLFQETAVETSEDEKFKESLALALSKIESPKEDTTNKDDVTFELKELPQTKKEDNDEIILGMWQSEIQSHYCNYDLEKPHEYGCHFFKNVGTLFSNIGIYHRNKDRAKQMIYDYNYYYHSESLHRLIDYTLYNNSIKKAVGHIFRNTALGRHESTKEREHRYYMEEIHNAITAQNTTAPILIKA